MRSWVEGKRVLSYAKLMQTYTAFRCRMWFFFCKSLSNLLWNNLRTFLFVLQPYKSSVCLINRNTHTLKTQQIWVLSHCQIMYCGPVSRLLFSFLESCKLCFSHNSWGFIWGAVGPHEGWPWPWAVSLGPGRLQHSLTRKRHTGTGDSSPFKVSC